MDMKKRIIAAAVAVLLLCSQLCGVYAGEIDNPDLFGTIDGDSYTNNVLGISCTLEGWYYYSQQELSLYASGITVMFAESGKGTAARVNSNVNMQARDLSVYSSAPSTDSEVEEMFTSGLDDLRASYEQQGFQDIQMEKGETLIGQQRRWCIKSSFKSMGIAMYQEELCFLRGKYLVFLTVTGNSFEETEEILSCFSLT